ncbi:MAG: vWA domain-containing protein [Bacilli bacterium]|nr:vWA domain-containing protein [Bacilli bacterium]
MKKYVIVALAVVTLGVAGYSVFGDDIKSLVQVNNNKYLEDGEENNTETEGENSSETGGEEGEGGEGEEFESDDDEGEGSDDGSGTGATDGSGTGTTDGTETVIEPEDGFDDSENNEDAEEYTTEPIADGDYDDDTIEEEKVELSDYEQVSVDLKTPTNLVCPFSKVYYNTCTKQGTGTINNTCSSPTIGNDETISMIDTQRVCESKLLDQCDVSEGDDCDPTPGECEDGKTCSTPPVLLSRRIVVLIDDSNSMNVEGLNPVGGKGKIDQVNKFFEKLITVLSNSGTTDPEKKARKLDRLSVCYFNRSTPCIGGDTGRYYSWWLDKIKKDKILTAAMCPDSHTTNFQRAYKRAYNQLKKMGKGKTNNASNKSKSPMVIMLTDGYPTSAFSGTTDIKKLDTKSEFSYPFVSSSFLMVKSASTLRSFVKAMKSSAISNSKLSRTNARFYPVGIGMYDSDKLAKFVMAPNLAGLSSSDTGETGELYKAYNGIKYKEVVASVAAFPDYGVINGSLGSSYINFNISGLLTNMNKISSSTKGLAFKFTYNSNNRNITGLQLCSGYNTSTKKYTGCRDIISSKICKDSNGHANKTKCFYSTHDGSNKTYIIKKELFSKDNYKNTKYARFKGVVGWVKGQSRQEVKYTFPNKYGADAYNIGNFNDDTQKEILKAITAIGQVVDPSVAPIPADLDPDDNENKAIWYKVPITGVDHSKQCSGISETSVYADNVCYNVPGVGKRKVTIYPANGVVLEESSKTFTMQGEDPHGTYPGGYFVWKGFTLNNDIKWYYAVSVEKGNPIIRIKYNGSYINNNETIDLKKSNYLSFKDYHDKLYTLNASGGCSNTPYGVNNLSATIGKQLMEYLDIKVDDRGETLKDSVTTVDSNDASKLNANIPLNVHYSIYRPSDYYDSDTHASSNIYTAKYVAQMKKSWVSCSGNMDCSFKYQTNAPNTKYQHDFDDTYYVPYGYKGDKVYYTFDSEFSTIIDENYKLREICEVNVNSKSICLDSGKVEDCSFYLRFRPISTAEPFPTGKVSSNWFDFWKEGNNRLRIQNSFSRKNGIPEYKTDTSKVRAYSDNKGYDKNMTNITNNGTSNYVNNPSIFDVVSPVYNKKGYWEGKCDDWEC